MQRALTVLALWLLQGAALAEEGFEEPAFAVPVVVGGAKACGSTPISALRSRGNSVLSILRHESAQALAQVLAQAPTNSQAESPKDFIAVGRSSARDEASCVIEVALEHALEEPRIVGIDFRGAEAKDPGTTARLTIELGPQRHRFEHAVGQLLEDRGPQLKRFQLGLPAGTRSFQIAVSGRAERLNDSDEARLGFDSLDLCFVDPEELEFCGGPGYPNPRARN